jgi:hypothetical protein
MQILTRLNKVIAYSEYGYIPVGNSAICAVTNECHHDALIVTVDCVPTDIDQYDYYYINGKFVKGNAGSITTIKTITGAALRFFVGTHDEYGQLTEKEKENLFAIITDDTTKENILTTLSTLQQGQKTQEESLTLLQNSLKNGTFVVKEATHAESANNATNATHLKPIEIKKTTLVCDKSLSNTSRVTMGLQTGKTYLFRVAGGFSYHHSISFVMRPTVTEDVTTINGNTFVQYSVGYADSSIFTFEGETVYFSLSTQPEGASTLYMYMQSSGGVWNPFTQLSPITLTVEYYEIT